MPRYLVCLDPQPAQDGSCAQSAWVEVAGVADILPTPEQGNVVGMAIFAAFVTLAVLRLLNTRKGDSE